MQMLRWIVIAVVLMLAVARMVAAEPLTITGTVVDAAGKPLPGAEVWLLQIESFGTDEPTTTAVRADANGSFVFPNITAQVPPPEIGMLTVVAYQAPLALGWIPLSDKTAGLQVRCLAASRVEGRVVGADGNGLKATIIPAYISPEQYEDDGPRQLFLSKDLKDKFAVHCDATGHYALTCTPPHFRVDLEVSAAGYGRYTTDNAQPIAPVLELKAPGRAEVRVSCPDKPQSVSGLQVQVWGSNRGLTYFSTLKTDDRGQVALDELQPGTYSVVVAMPATSPWQTRGAVDIKIIPEATAQAEVRLEKAVLVTGRVLDRDTGEPVAGVAMWSSAYGMAPPSVATDGEGRYSLYLLPGEAQIYAAGMGEEGPPPSVTVVVRDQGGSAPDLKVQRGLTVEGLVVDKDGRPVVGATVYRSSNLFARRRVQSGDGGKFALTHVGAADEVTVWAQCGDAIMPRELTFRGDEAPKPLTLVLTPTPPVRLRVKVVDQDGRAIAGVGVKAQWSHQPLGKTVDLGTTDANGVCVSESQVAFGSYQLRAKTDASDAASSAEWEAVAGNTHDFGVLRLTLAAGYLAGRIVDQDGKPVVGAAVFNSGDGPRRVTSVSDEQGHFRLSGLYPGRAFVFADMAGFHFTGVCAPTGADDVVVHLTPLPKGETALASQVSPASRDEDEVRAAREILRLALIQAVAQPPDKRTGHLIGMLATIDLEEAKAFSQVLGLFDADIAVELGKHLMATQPDEALAEFEKVSGDPDKYVHCQVYAAATLVDIDPVRARRQFEKAFSLARMQTDEGLRAVYLARLGTAMLPLDRALGEAALREGQKLVETRMARDGIGAQRRSEVAAYLASLDVDAAQELVQFLTVDEAHGTYYQANLTAAVAEIDPARAEQLLLRLPKYEQAGNTLDVACAMAPRDAERAIRLAHQIDGRDHAVTRRRTLAYLAKALVRSDSAVARSLFDEAIAGLGAPATAPNMPPPGFTGPEASTFPQSSILMTELAVIGKQIGHPLAGDLAWRTAAIRSGASDSLYAGDWYERTALVANLALVAPEIGRELALIQLSRPYKSGEDWPQQQLCATAFTALILADPRRGSDAVPPNLRQPGSTKVYDQAASWLLADPVRRPATILSRYGFHSPGTEEPRWW
ncbi:MAG: carboxypeptidase regulatory-like domain-containing protein [Armatimonadia bacterium]